MLMMQCITREFFPHILFKEPNMKFDATDQNDHFHYDLDLFVKSHLYFCFLFLEFHAEMLVHYDSTIQRKLC